MKKGIILTMLMATFSYVANAQGYKVHLKDGTVVSIRADKTDSITFTDAPSFKTEGVGETNIVMTTKDAKDVANTSATLCGGAKGVIDIEKTASYGFLYGTKSGLTTSTAKSVSSKLSSGSLESKVSDLTKGTKYYYKPFALVDGKYTYGDERYFSTSSNTEPASDKVKSGEVIPDYFTATINVIANVGDDVPFYEVGVIVSADSNPTKENGILYNKSVNATSEPSKETAFSINYCPSNEKLSINTTYYYRSYVYTYTDGQYHYDDVKTFKTLDVSPEPAVDMGTDVKWARCNIGASSPEEYGDYYAWGETNTKEVYTKDTYIYYNNGVYADFGNDISGSAFDVAHVKLGGTWRTPTAEEWKKLMNRCLWEWITYNGNQGYLVINRSNNNSIFLPAAGERMGGSLDNTGSSIGCYWSSSLDKSHCDSAWELHFIGSRYCDSRRSSRDSGNSVRAVCE